MPESMSETSDLIQAIRLNSKLLAMSMLSKRPGCMWCGRLGATRMYGADPICEEAGCATKAAAWNPNYTIVDLPDAKETRMLKRVVAGEQW